jgi:hypothetical protein
MTPSCTATYFIIAIWIRVKETVARYFVVGAFCIRAFRLGPSEYLLIDFSPKVIFFKLSIFEGFIALTATARYKKQRIFTQFFFR